ncbi:MAG: hypothetical protein EOP49_35120, partial [Sphingobacteriales bacterium]
MKVIVSHDVDHLYWSDHFADTFIPGLLLRSTKEVLSGGLSVGGFIKRFNPARKLHNLEALAKTLQKHAIPANFFFGMGKGLNLSYENSKAAPVIKWLTEQGFEVGVHGISYDDSSSMQQEQEEMTAILGVKPKGIRNHYLRRSENTFELMAGLGYTFDSTDYGIKPPYKVKEMWEIPISVMDVDVCKGATGDLLQKSKEYTLQKLDEARAVGLPFFVVNFHDVYYS